MVASVRQIAAVAASGNPIVATFGLPVLASSRLAVLLNTRGNASSITRAGWTMNAGIIATAASPNDQHMAGWCTAGIETGHTVLNFGSSLAGGGQLVALELADVGDLRQWLMSRQTQNAQPSTLPLSIDALDGSLILGLFCMRPPDGVGMTGVPVAGWTEVVDATPSPGGLHPWDYVASRVAVGPGPYSPGVTGVYNWSGDFGAGFAGTAMEFPAVVGGRATPGEPGGAVW